MRRSIVVEVDVECSRVGVAADSVPHFRVARPERNGRRAGPRSARRVREGPVLYLVERSSGPTDECADSASVGKSSANRQGRGGDAGKVVRTIAIEELAAGKCPEASTTTTNGKGAGNRGIECNAHTTNDIQACGETVCCLTRSSEGNA